MADQLLTLFHISDLHVGDIAPRAARLDAQMGKSWSYFTPLLGYLGHTGVALRQLRRAWWEILEEDRQVHVVVTGDLTATGAAGQYSNALTYLRGKLIDPRTSQGIGLELDQHQSPTLIPGNHDHWPGHECRGVRLAVCMQGSETPAFEQVFPNRAAGATANNSLYAMPLQPVRIPLANGCTVVLAGLDSDAEVPGVGIRRLAARGSFVKQCVEVQRQLGGPKPDELRVLLLHHSSIIKGVPGYKLRITSRSRQTLVKLVREAGIAIVLTGHQHWADYSRPVDNPDIVEARCGATTCRDYFDDSLDTGGILCHNSLLVHRLLDDNRGGIVWQTEIRERREWEDPFVVVETVSFGRLWSR